MESDNKVIMGPRIKKIATTLVATLEPEGLGEAICSPGSRNIPLLQAFRHSEINCRMVVDERTAAFVALGLAQSKGMPVALVCTSGSALLNYAPAAAEAYYQGIPLIVISADRPEQWIDQDDSQTIRQYGALANFTKRSYDLADTDASLSDGEWYINRTVSDACLCATEGKPGPVHLNIRFSRPLTPPADSPIEADKRYTRRVIRRLDDEGMPSRSLIKSLALRAKGQRILLVAGFGAPDARLNKAVKRLLAHPNVEVMAETISNLHLPADCYCVDPLLCDREPEYPDIVISIGGALVSRMLKAYLRAAPAEMEHWCVGFNHTTVDCFQHLTDIIECDPAALIGQLSAELAHQEKIAPQEADSQGLWHISELRKRAMKRIDLIASETDWSELKAHKILADHVPAEANLVLSNGTSVRYDQLLRRRLPHAEDCNRGVSGIDGCTSTALGLSLGYSGETWLISGDMSLTYDLGGLFACRPLDATLKVIVISNGGGGIFRFIEASSRLDIREEMLCVDTRQDMKAIAVAAGSEIRGKSHAGEAIVAAAFSLPPEANPARLKANPARPSK